MVKDVFHRALVWVEENLCTGKDVSALVRQSGCGRRAFEQNFRLRSGFSPGEYLFRRRMTRAAIMLRMTSLPVTEIAALLHYYSGQNFTRAFRRFSGETPTAYRCGTAWKTQTLQLPLFYGKGDCCSSVVEFSQCLWITGSRKYMESRYDSMSDREYLRALRNQLDSLQVTSLSGMLVLCRRNVNADTYTGRKGMVRVETVAGTQVAFGEQADDCIPAGRYVRYEFSGSWEEFAVFSRTIYMRLLAEQHLYCSGELNFMQVYSFGDHLECALYIPVESPSPD